MISLPGKVRSCAINDTLMIFVHLKKGTVLASRLSELHIFIFNILPINNKSRTLMSNNLYKEGEDRKTRREPGRKFWQGGNEDKLWAHVQSSSGFGLLHFPFYSSLLLWCELWLERGERKKKEKKRNKETVAGIRRRNMSSI